MDVSLHFQIGGGYKITIWMRKWWYHWMLECLSQETWSYQREKWCYHHQEHDFDHRNCRFFHYKCFNFGMQSSRAPVMTPVGLVLFIDRINVEKNWSLGSLNHKYNHYRPKIHHLEMISYGKCAWVVTRHGLDLIQDNFDDRFLKKNRQPVFPQTEKNWPPMGTFGRQGTHQTMLWHHLGDPSGYRGAHLQWPLNDLPEIWSWLPTTQLDAKLCQVVVKPAFCGGKYHFNQKTPNYTSLVKIEVPKNQVLQNFTPFRWCVFLAYLQMYSSSNLDHLVPGKPRFPGDFPLGEHPSSNLNRVQLQIRLGGRKNQWFFMWFLWWFVCDFRGNFYVYGDWIYWIEWDFLGGIWETKLRAWVCLNMVVSPSQDHFIGKIMMKSGI